MRISPRKPLRISLLFLLVTLFCSIASAQPKRGDVVFQENFNRPDALKDWQGVAAIKAQLETGYNGTSSLSVDHPAALGAGRDMIQLPVPLEKLRGLKVRCEAMVKAQDVIQPPHVYNGLKVMLHTVDPSGERWIQQDNVYGTFDWKKIYFTTDIAADTTEATLMVGIESTTGKVWIDDIKITVVGMPRQRPTHPPTGPIYKGHDLSVLRGAMISPNIKESDLRVLGGEWKANHIRWQLLWNGFPHSPADNGDLDAYDVWLESALKHLDELLPVCKELGVLVLVDLHTPPGGREPSKEMALFHQKKFQDKFLELWEKIARRYKGNPVVWGYDLVNEPVEGIVDDGLMDWYELATATAKRVRAIDPDHAIIVEPAPWAATSAFKEFEPIPVDRVVYSVHMYNPGEFTHQGLYDNPAGVTYPGLINGKMWDKEALRKSLQPVIDFQKDYNVRIDVGEFSAIRWAPGNSAYNWLRDCIEIFEENHWDWSYHAFREFNGWSVEHGPDRDDTKPAATPTEREQLLRSWFEKNERPSFATPLTAKPLVK